MGTPTFTVGADCEQWPQGALVRCFLRWTGLPSAHYTSCGRRLAALTLEQDCETIGYQSLQMPLAAVTQRQQWRLSAKVSRTAK